MTRVLTGQGDDDRVVYPIRRSSLGPDRPDLGPDARADDEVVDSAASSSGVAGSFLGKHQVARDRL